MGKTYKKIRKSSSRRKSRSRRGGLESTSSMSSMPSMSSMSNSVNSFASDAKKTADKHYQMGMDSAKKAADKHIDAAQKLTAQHSENVKNIGMEKMDSLNKNVNSTYNNIKYSSAKNFAAAKIGENTFNQGKNIQNQ